MISILKHIVMLMLVFKGNAHCQSMTKAFPLGCKSVYTPPFTFQIKQNQTRNNSVCIIASATNCSETLGPLPSKCIAVQSSVRKLMIATNQTSQCGKVNVTRVQSNRAPYTATFQRRNNATVSGISTMMFHHPGGKSAQTALDIVRIKPFRQNDSSIDGYTICVNGDLLRMCLLDKSKRIRIATYDVSDHSCDSGAYINVQ